MTCTTTIGQNRKNDKKADCEMQPAFYVISDTYGLKETELCYEYREAGKDCKSFIICNLYSLSVSGADHHIRIVQFTLQSVAQGSIQLPF